MNHFCFVLVDPTNILIIYIKPASSPMIQSVPWEYCRDIKDGKDFFGREIERAGVGPNMYLEIFV